MTAAATSIQEPMATHHFVLVTEGADLLEWEALDALYEAGGGDATVGHQTLEFDRAAPTRDEALCSALRDAESVPGLRGLHIEFQAAGEDQPALSTPSQREPPRAGRARSLGAWTTW